MTTKVDPESLPLLPITNNLDREDLYTVVKGDTCRRCKGSGIDPDGEYKCLLCHGEKIEKWGTGAVMFCATHPDKELVYIGKRFVTWEDGQGFDHSGHLGVKGCPICRIAAYSVMRG